VVTGRVTDPTTGAPVAGARVSLTGHDSGSPGDYTATTDASGHYVIRDVFIGAYPIVTIEAPGYLPVDRSVTVKRGVTTADVGISRDWAAASGGASVVAFNGPDFSPFCGPGGAIDTSLGAGWGSTTGDDQGTPTNVMVPKFLVVRLPEPIRLSSFAVDPNATCGDPGSSSTGKYRIETSRDGAGWTTVREGSFNAQDRGRLNELRVKPVEGVRYVRFTMLSPQVPNFATNCPNGAFSGCQFTDLSELAVLGAPPAVADRGSAAGEAATTIRGLSRRLPER